PDRAAPRPRPDGERVETHPARHKGSWRNKPRVVFIGPEAIEVLAPWVEATPTPGDYVFSPARAEAAKTAERSAAGVTNRWPSHMKRNTTKRKGEKRRRAPGAFYTHTRLSCALRRACDRAKIKRFTPYALRHLKAAELRARFGLETVRAVLGHSFAQ